MGVTTGGGMTTKRSKEEIKIGEEVRAKSVPVGVKLLFFFGD